jgi:uncharacterized membrane protein
MSKDMRQRPSGPLSGEYGGTSGRIRPAAPPTAAAPTGGSAQTQPAPAQKLSPAEYNTAMVHFYRGEVQRANTWRNRLDTTTNWAVITTGATLSFTFGDQFSPHFVILINTLLVSFFLLMEARRYRYYEIWSSRVRIVETGYFAQLLSTESTADRQWAGLLAGDLMTPHFTISEWEAIGRRLRRNYLWIFMLLAACWNLKVYLHPTEAKDLSIFVSRAQIGVVPGPVVLFAGLVFNLGLIIFAIATVRLREATGEVLPRHDFSFKPLQRVTEWTRAAANERTRRRAQRARHRVRTTSTLTATGEFKRVDTTETPDRKPVTEEVLK